MTQKKTPKLIQRQIDIGHSASSATMEQARQLAAGNRSYELPEEDRPKTMSELQAEAILGDWGSR